MSKPTRNKPFAEVGWFTTRAMEARRIHRAIGLH